MAARLLSASVLRRWARQVPLPALQRCKPTHEVIGSSRMITLAVQPMQEDLFAPFGDLVDFDRKPDFSINQGMCDRFHGLAHPVVKDDDGHVAISLGRGKPYELPLKLEMMERHPLGSQAFIPLEPNPFLVIVAKDDGGKPINPVAFKTRPGQGVNYHHNIWHAVLTPLDKQTDFIIIDRFGEGENLEEHDFKTPYIIAES